MCQTRWPDRENFLADPALDMIGYQADIESLENGLFLFNHLAENCKSTIAVRVHQFRDLYAGPVHQKCLIGTEDCEGMCLHRENLQPCQAECECRYVRDLVQIVKNWKKKTSAG